MGTGRPTGAGGPTGTGADARHDDGVAFRRPTLDDGKAVYDLVVESGVLEPNSPYAYLLLCSDFADGGVVAEREGDLVGFVMGYRPPPRPEALFVWQVGVHSSARGQGIGGRLLDALVRLTPDATHVEATVAPGNGPSRALFTAFARRWGAPCEVGEGFRTDHFPTPSDPSAPPHEPEERYRIGPLRRDS